MKKIIPMYTVNILISRQKKNQLQYLFSTQFTRSGTSRLYAVVPVLYQLISSPREHNANKTRTQHVRYNIIYIIQFSSDRISSFWIFFFINFWVKLQSFILY